MDQHSKKDGFPNLTLFSNEEKYLDALSRYFEDHMGQNTDFEMECNLIRATKRGF